MKDNAPGIINRRELVRITALGAALPALPAVAQHEHSAPKTKQPPSARPVPALKFLTPAQNAFVAQLSELIIPQTDTPGAKAAFVSYYIDKMLSASDAASRRTFLDGLAWLDTRSRQLHGADFMRLTETQQVKLLEPLATRANIRQEDQPGVRFFERVKVMTVAGYYTSAEGILAELGYANGFTGEFPGCTDPEHKG